MWLKPKNIQSWVGWLVVGLVAKDSHRFDQFSTISVCFFMFLFVKFAWGEIHAMHNCYAGGLYLCRAMWSISRAIEYFGLYEIVITR